MSGCTIVPGLNIHFDDDDHQYQIASNKDENGYSVVQTAGGPAVSYRIVPLEPEVLSQLDNEAASPGGSALPGILPSDVPPDYQIGPGDIIYVTIWDHPELTSPFATPSNDTSVSAVQGRMLNANGDMFYPYVGIVHAIGMTSMQLREYLTVHIAGVISNPQIDVRVVAYRANRVEVTGEVMKPGTVTLDDTPKGVLQVLGLSGGLTPAASRRTVLLERKGQIYDVDLASLLSGSRLMVNPGVLPGDVVHVPDQSRDQVFMLGAVTSQKPIVLQQDAMSLLQALTTSGGLDAVRSDQSGVYVFRTRRENGIIQSTVFTVDLSQPKGVLMASQFMLQSRDVVYVKSTGFAQYNAVVNELLPTITGLYELFESYYIAKNR